MATPSSCVAVLVCTGVEVLTEKLLPKRAGPNPLGPLASVGAPQLRESKVPTLAKRVEKQPLLPTLPSPVNGPDSPATVKLQVRVKVPLATRFPPTAASRLASRHNRLMRVSGKPRRLPCPSTVKFRTLRPEIQGESCPSSIVPMAPQRQPQENLSFYLSICYRRNRRSGPTLGASTAQVPTIEAK